jgi:hypothetical protein
MWTFGRTYNVFNNELKELISINRPRNNMCPNIPLNAHCSQNAVTITTNKISIDYPMSCAAMSLKDCLAIFTGFIDHDNHGQNQVLSNKVLPVLAGFLISL